MFGVGTTYPSTGQSELTRVMRPIFNTRMPEWRTLPRPRSEGSSGNRASLGRGSLEPTFLTHIFAGLDFLKQRSTQQSSLQRSFGTRSCRTSNFRARTVLKLISKTLTSVHEYDLIKLRHLSISRSIMPCLLGLRWKLCAKLGSDKGRS